MGTEQLDVEVVETVAGVVRLLRRAAELAWAQAEGGPRSSRQLFALGIDSAADEASSLLPAGLGWTGLGQLGRTQQSFSHRLGTCCIKSVSRMHHPAC